jgi:hypothetical protein
MQVEQGGVGIRLRHKVNEFEPIHEPSLKQQVGASYRSRIEVFDERYSF